jgi:hypothetical protein
MSVVFFKINAGRQWLYSGPGNWEARIDFESTHATNADVGLRFHVTPKVTVFRYGIILYKG